MDKRLLKLSNFLRRKGFLLESAELVKLARDSDFIYQTFGRMIEEMVKEKKYTAIVTDNEDFDKSVGEGFARPADGFFKSYSEVLEVLPGNFFYEDVLFKALKDVASDYLPEESLESLGFYSKAKKKGVEIILTILFDCIKNYYYPWGGDKVLKRMGGLNSYLMGLKAESRTPYSMSRLFSRNFDEEFANCFDNKIKEYMGGGDIFSEEDYSLLFKVIKDRIRSITNFFTYKLSVPAGIAKDSGNDFKIEMLLNKRTPEVKKEYNKFLVLKFDKVESPYDLFNKIAERDYKRTFVTLDNGERVSPADSFIGDKNKFNEFFKNFVFIIHKIRGSARGYMIHNAKMFVLGYEGPIAKDNIDQILNDSMLDPEALSTMYHEMSHVGRSNMLLGRIGRSFSDIKGVKYKPSKSGDKNDKGGYKVKRSDNYYEDADRFELGQIKNIRYFSDTEEVQARLIQTFNSFENYAKSNSNDDKSTLASYMILMLDPNSSYISSMEGTDDRLNSFAEYMILFSEPLQGNIEFFSKKHKKKIKNRIKSYGLSLLTMPEFELMVEKAKESINRNADKAPDFDNFNIEQLVANKFKGVFEGEPRGL